MRAILERRPIVTSVTYTIIGAAPLYLVSAMIAAIRQDIALGTSELGFIVATFYLVSAVASRRVGPRIDRDGGTRGLRRSALLTCLSCAAIAFVAHHWVVIAVLLGVVGLANAYGQIGSNLVIATDVRHGRQGLAFSAKQAAVPMSAMVSGTASSLIGVTGGWRWPFLVVSGVSLVLFFGCPRFVPVSNGEEAMRASRRLPATLIALMLAAAIGGGVGNSFAAFTADAAVATGFTPSVAGLLLTFGSVLAIVSRISAGINADRRGRSGVLETTTLLSVGVVGLAILGLWGSSPTVFAAGLLVTFFGAWGWQGVMSFVVIRTVPLPAATSTGALAAAVYFGTVVVPPIVGIVAERYSYPTVFTAQSLLLLGAVVAVLTACAMAARSRD